MAHVAYDPALTERIDAYLDYLKAAWEGVPLDAEEWHMWDEHSRLVFDLDWGVPEDRLAEVTRLAEQGCLTTAQRERFDRVLILVETYRPLLTRMLAE